MTAEEALDEIEEIINGPIGDGADQAAVWYSKLCAVREVIEDYQDGADGVDS
jgi:hypothetical protein